MAQVIDWHILNYATKYKFENPYFSPSNGKKYLTQIFILIYICFAANPSVVPHTLSAHSFWQLLLGGKYTVFYFSCSGAATFFFFFYFLWT